MMITEIVEMMIAEFLLMIVDVIGMMSFACLNIDHSQFTSYQTTLSSCISSSIIIAIITSIITSIITCIDDFLLKVNEISHIYPDGTHAVKGTYCLDWP